MGPVDSVVGQCPVHGFLVVPSHPGTDCREGTLKGLLYRGPPVSTPSPLGVGEVTSLPTDSGSRPSLGGLVYRRSGTDSTDLEMGR